MVKAKQQPVVSNIIKLTQLVSFDNRNTDKMALISASFELKNHNSCSCKRDVMEGLLSDNW